MYSVPINILPSFTFKNFVKSSLEPDIQLITNKRQKEFLS